MGTLEWRCDGDMKCVGDQQAKEWERRENGLSEWWQPFWAQGMVSGGFGCGEEKKHHSFQEPLGGHVAGGRRDRGTV